MTINRRRASSYASQRVSSFAAARRLQRLRRAQEKAVQIALEQSLRAMTSRSTLVGKLSGALERLRTKGILNAQSEATLLETLESRLRKLISNDQALPLYQLSATRK